MAILSFHSGEDRRVKKAFKSGVCDGRYASISDDVIRPSAEEQRANPRSSAAKLEWAIRAAADAFVFLFPRQLDGHGATRRLVPPYSLPLAGP